MSQYSPIALGLDFGTESVRALFVDLDGNERASAVVAYPHGQITEFLPGTENRLPADFALQHPLDWIESAAQERCGRASPAASWTPPRSKVLASISRAAPCCRPWRTARLCAFKVAGRRRNSPGPSCGSITAPSRKPTGSMPGARAKEPWLDRYGGTIGLEWFFPKMLETLENAPDVSTRPQVWLEAGDWFVWQLVGGPASAICPLDVPGGIQGSVGTGTRVFPSAASFGPFIRKLANVVADPRCPGGWSLRASRPGRSDAAMAERFGLPAGIPDQRRHDRCPRRRARCRSGRAGHAGHGDGNQQLPHAQRAVRAGRSRRRRQSSKRAFLPGYFGYETGQAAVGDAFDWFRGSHRPRKLRSA